jgi:AcrR family transcriptional regulator
LSIAIEDESTDASLPNPRRRGAYAKTEARKSAILEAAFQIFAANGYRSGSIRDVAEIVGISEAGLLHHFPNKVALLEGVLRERDARSFLMVQPNTLHGVKFAEGLIRVAEYNETVPGIVELFCVLSAEATAPDHPAHEYFRERYRWVHEMTTTAFNEAATDGELIENANPASVARMFIALWDGLQLQWLLNRESVDIATELRSFLRGVTTPIATDRARQE